MTLLLSPEVSSHSNLLSGRAISEHLLQSGKIPVDADQGLAPDAENPEKEAANEKLRAERFGIQGAIIDRFTDSVIIEDAATGRPALNFEIVARPLEVRGWPGKAGFLDDGPDGPGTYEIWQPMRSPENMISDFQEDFGAMLDKQSAQWGAAQLAPGVNPEVAAWANRLVKVGRQQRDLDVVEAVIGDNEMIKGGNDAPDTPYTAIEQLPMSNISALYGELAEVALGCLDEMGITDENERLSALDDIVLQSRDISQHHIAHLNNGELGEIDDAPRLRELGASLYKDEDGRWHLEWDGRVKAKPKDKIFSRTQHCPAAYQIEGEPSAIERLGWAFNTELQKRGFLKPGAVALPAPTFEFPSPIKIGKNI